jgi:signal transduction histidine kinase
VRQNVLLFFKEAVHNAVRHAEPSRVEVRWRLSRRALSLHVSDDGRGFDPAAARRGTGLLSLRRRADELGGAFTLTSAPGEGTRVALDVPLGTAWPRWWRTPPSERPV